MCTSVRLCVNRKRQYVDNKICKLTDTTQFGHINLNYVIKSVSLHK